MLGLLCWKTLLHFIRCPAVLVPGLCSSWFRVSFLMGEGPPAVSLC